MYPPDCPIVPMPRWVATPPAPEASRLLAVMLPAAELPLSAYKMILPPLEVMLVPFNDRLPPVELAPVMTRVSTLAIALTPAATVICPPCPFESAAVIVPNVPLICVSETMPLAAMARLVELLELVIVAPDPMLTAPARTKPVCWGQVNERVPLVPMFTAGDMRCAELLGSTKLSVPLIVAEPA